MSIHEMHSTHADRPAPEPPTDGRTWDEILAPYKKSDDMKATFQLLSTATLFVGLWWVTLQSLEWGYVWTILLALPMAGLSARLFIFQHDCGHGSFFSSRRANNVVGAILGVITLTPYQYWRRTHAHHHATAGNLDHREFGDVDTLTVNEYLALPWYRRAFYRIYRSGFVLLTIGPVYQFVLKHRLPLDAPFKWKKEWRGVMITNLALVAAVLVMGELVGFKRFFMVHTPIVVAMGTLGVWLFYVQHQFEDTYWDRDGAWNYYRAGLVGSSYYDLPRVLHWFTGNIGYHHIHHLSSLIPNYRLARCMKENPELHQVTRLTVWSSLKCMGLKLWDEESRRLVGFSHLRRHRAAS